MRREPTDAEAKMWRLLRDRRLEEFKFRRQVPLEGYIVDFACFDRKVIVEIDGSQHAGSSHDTQRDLHFRQEGFLVLRYWNNDVLQSPASVLEDLFEHLSKRPL